jgi:hypothetical protein
MSRINDQAYRDLLDRKWSETGGHCWYCGEATKKFGGRTLDHVWPHAHGGSEHESNFVAACSTCNGIKGNQSIREFRLQMARRRADWPNFKPAQWAWLRINVVLPTLPHFEFYGESQGLSLPEGKPERILPTGSEGLPTHSEGFQGVRLND